MIDLSKHIKLECRTDWIKFLGCATEKIALQHEEPEYPCLALRIPAEPDWASDRFTYLTNSDASRIWFALYRKTENPPPRLMIPMTDSEYTRALKRVVECHPNMTLHDLSRLTSRDRMWILAHMDGETFNIIRAR